MTPTTAATCFAPAERSTAEDIKKARIILSSHEVPAILNAVPVISMVLDTNRQVVFGNKKFLEAAGIKDLDEALGKRPGEAFRCVHAHKTPGGCGTTEFCSQCGAVRSILLGIEGRQNIQECSIRREHDGHEEALDLRVSSAPFSLDGLPFVIFSISDVSHEKRRRALERIFFHDILNTVGGLRGLLDYLREEAPEELRADADLIHHTISQLAEEIVYQKQLLAAESNELETNAITLRSRDILDIVRRTFASSDEARGKHLVVDPGAADLLFQSDFALLRRVLGNMVKNALEASEPGQTVTMGCRAGEGTITLWVANPAFIPRSAQLRVFNRSFSTKGPGRGLGTYSIKLLTERYLDGRADFESHRETGTEFRVTLPHEPIC